MLGDQRGDGIGALDAGQVRAGIKDLQARAGDGGGDRLPMLGRDRRVLAAGDDERGRADAGQAPRRSMVAIASQQPA